VTSGRRLEHNSCRLPSGVGVQEPILRTIHLTREVSGLRLVDDISVEVYRGDILAVVGPSGSGKSSFLRLLNRLDEPTAGNVYFEGKDYREIPPRELRRKIGLVTQVPFLFPGAVADNLRFGPSQQGKQLSDEAVASLLEEVGLAAYATKDAHYLSGGEAQRVSLARTLANSPSVLLLDEPTSALDVDSRQGIEELILRIVRLNQLTCVLVTHDLGQAARMANRAMVLKAGKLERVGLIGEVLRVQAGV